MMIRCIKQLIGSGALRAIQAEFLRSIQHLAWKSLMEYQAKRDSCTKQKIEMFTKETQKKTGYLCIHSMTNFFKERNVWNCSEFASF